ncbi:MULTISPECIES: bifunctional serine/threonine-protein kinase/formylglycine-generating enzyme family protein [unclassified Dolichospermum]|uniref:bifunctional serine/threonine-protein kinase/formylglycine-generating enzyme family protein n=1 Tax=unclassified Dolichospermum TaxID=2622029 RepID=UPI001446DD18|nr:MULTISPECIES: bifunctional serine/threonine-protein kinase/formylglycine-generating enzyme family protein [unclassified Dolichospermum]MTJ16081.1 SUMF1/EgtB/PvdOfamily nonheme iron enzyme [Dolichospermum sp. UHCC 0299]MTJ40017.1 SUMF1/EgtB/PvdOfamily nonheme iron enzyme [Dolichospermum sp. UHCC 0406]
MAYFTPGQLLKKGQYEIIDTLGQGGFGITYLAQDHKRKKEVAIKSLNVSFLKQRYRDKYGNTEGFGDFLAEEQDKFNTEAMVLATFDHPHIVKVYPELFQENGLSCMVMEYVKGKNLEQYLYANGVFSESAGLEIIKGIGEALSYIHSRNYLHRDIKPANILLREEDNKAILIDFGLAREVNFAELMSLTNAKTPVFAPPEQFENRSNFTPALDIYALAATLYVIIAVHEPPFIPLPSPYLNAKIMLDMKMAIEPPQKYNSQISQKVNDAILKGMELDYQNRPQSITEWFRFLGIQSQNNHLKTFTFEVVTTNAKGSIINKRNHSANYFVEDLGNGVKLEMVEIPAGTFHMGSPTYETGRLYYYESPQHQVNVPSFFIGKYSVTQAQYQAIMGNNPAYFKGNNRPAEFVSWDDAVVFCQKLSQKTGKNYKLPSEAQWEYACRAGTTTPFYFGESITPDLVNYNGEFAYTAAPKGQYREQTTDVGTFPPNAFGLYDMHGNVCEWCEDNWQENYINAPINGSAFINLSNVKLLRGGSWFSNSERCRSAYRGYNILDHNDDGIGFRVVCSGAART